MLFDFYWRLLTLPFAGTILKTKSNEEIDVLRKSCSKQGGALKLEIVDERVHLTGNSVTVLSGNRLIESKF